MITFPKLYLFDLQACRYWYKVGKLQRKKKTIPLETYTSIAANPGIERITKDMIRHLVAAFFCLNHSFYFNWRWIEVMKYIEWMIEGEIINR